MSKRTIKQYNASKQYESSDKKTSALITVLGLTAIAGAGAVLYNSFYSNPESEKEHAAEHTCSEDKCDHYHHGGGYMYIGSGGTGSSPSMRSTSSFSSRPAASAGVSRGFFGSIGGFVSG